MPLAMGMSAVAEMRERLVSTVALKRYMTNVVGRQKKANRNVLTSIVKFLFLCSSFKLDKRAVSKDFC